MNTQRGLLKRNRIFLLTAILIAVALLAGACSPRAAQEAQETSTEEIVPADTSTPTLTATITETLAPSETPTATQPSVLTYTVREGDTFFGIADQFGTNLATLSALNPNVTPGLINVGDQLTVPGQGQAAAESTPVPEGEQTIIQYQVVAGDTLAAIASRFGSTINAIVNENGLQSADEIRVGQTLRIPVLGPTATQAP